MNAINEEKKMTDKIEKLGNSTIQHGKLNDRIYLMKFSRKDGSEILDLLSALAIKENYSKIFAKIPSRVLPLFLQDDYRIEATIPNFYKGTEDVFFMAKYLNEIRRYEEPGSHAVLSKLIEETDQNGDQLSNGGFKIKKLDVENIAKACEIYRQVFATYPFPIHEPAYIQETIESGDIEYFGVWEKDQLIGLSSAEMDIENQNAEMTDFAVLPDHRGKKLAQLLLQEMELAMSKKGFRTLYTIARLQSPGMNKTFINMGYKFSGTLINNTNISGKIESMNVYYKLL